MTGSLGSLVEWINGINPTPFLQGDTNLLGFLFGVMIIFYFISVGKAIHGSIKEKDGQGNQKDIERDKFEQTKLRTNDPFLSVIRTIILWITTPIIHSIVFLGPSIILCFLAPFWVVTILYLIQSIVFTVMATNDDDGFWSVLLICYMWTVYINEVCHKLMKKRDYKKKQGEWLYSLKEKLKNVPRTEQLENMLNAKPRK